MVNQINEMYLGINENILFIQEFLEKSRKEEPEKVKGLYKLSEVRRRDYRIEWELFDELVNFSKENFQNKYAKFQLIPPDRYYVGRGSDIGGFYGEKGGGFLDISSCGFAYLLGENRITNNKIRTIELVRNYLHDSFHYSTFRSFRRVAKHIKSAFPIYREQYGINLRNVFGISYSSVAHNKKSPIGINLNTLMDGCVQILVGQTLENYLEKVKINICYPLEVEVLYECLNKEFNHIIYHEPTKFYTEVIDPVRRFLIFWEDGDKVLLDLIVSSMLDGDIMQVKYFFEKKTLNPNIWEILFKQSCFRIH